MDDCHDPSRCKSVGEVLSRVGDRWSILIIFALGSGRMRFNALKRHLGISQRMLSLTLRALERDGLILRHYFPTIPPRVDYELTPLGQSLRVPVLSLANWAVENRTNIDTARIDFDGLHVKEAAG
jgi:DNA-binding HxlR family transcriptional regulator